jgi:IPT/TIG domain
MSRQVGSGGLVLLASALIAACGSPTVPTSSSLVVSSIAPVSGSTLGGTLVTITGSNFTEASTVAIGGANANATKFISSTSLTATTGQRAAGVADVVVVSGTQTATLPRAFTYVPPTPVTNTPPVIASIVALGTRINEPQRFADLNEEINVTATVQDAETPVTQLSYDWTSSAGGTFTGTGQTVKWRAPATVPFQAAATLTLTVTERYDSVDEVGLPVTKQNQVSSSIAVSIHDSANEVGSLARQFLLDFSDSSIRDVAYIMRNFQPGCYGTAEETGQVADNRIHFKILSSQIGPAAVTVRFGGFCPFRSKPGDACAQVPSTWNSIFLDDGMPTSVTGVDQVAAVYSKDEQRWRLCDSQYDGHQTGSLRLFMR